MKRQKTITGKLQINAKGFGFVLQDDEADIFISFDNLANAMDGDIVEAIVFGKGRKPSGKIIKIIERSGRNIIGIFRTSSGGGKVYPEDERLPSSLFIPQKEIENSKIGKELKDGQVVVARLMEWNNPDTKPRGTVTGILGNQDEAGIDLKVVALSHGLPLEFPEEVMQEAEKLRDPVIRKAVKNRLDLRKLDCFTIDPDTAKDFDDAVSLRQLPSGLFEIGVHIADVSHFVPENSVIDKEAWERGTSVYFVQKVLPMLPERLSNEICSLVPHKPRLAFSVLMQISSMGEIHDYQIAETVIESKQRFTYEEVEEIIKGREHKYASAIHLMQMLSQVLQKRREERGSIDFDMTETVITLDDEGIPRTIIPKKSLESHRLVEEFMLLANRTIAGHIVAAEKRLKSRIPFVYRVHEKPDESDVRAFLAMVANLGIPYKIGDAIEPDDYRNILGIIQNLEFKNLVEKVALQSMTKAVYSTENKGHFGLAFEAYTHFTSPIRRYPDLVVHRLLKRYLEILPAGTWENGKASSKAGNEQGVRRRLKEAAGLMDYLDTTCARSSEREKIAVAAEREYTKVKSLEFLSRKIGHTYEGIISGVTSFGLFIELSHYLVEGLVPLSSLKDDYYEYDSENYLYKGKESGRIFRLGDPVKVKIQHVSVADRKADFMFI
ncbi:ribonuclease R [Marispirochaeta sp.]|uniref:ribonuclease R n=1 Tax=Marispirochaeta sp. TaxID=2038653 RepID=UPI0029C69F89|nr:ribonuclease R [Marispirochaeta sp.]